MHDFMRRAESVTLYSASVCARGVTAYTDSRAGHQVYMRRSMHGPCSADNSSYPAPAGNLSGCVHLIHASEGREQAIKDNI